MTDKTISWNELTEDQRTQVKEQFLSCPPEQNARSRFTIGEDGKVISRRWPSGLVTRPMVRRKRA